ncbi:MAG: hypothetical protein H7838_13120, partial [Magnetococcus sp. DMHC-8]
ALHRFLTSDEEAPGAGGRAGRAVLEPLRTTLNLSNEERLLLKLLYQDGLEVEAVARLLGLNGNQVYGRQRRLLARIRKAMEQTGLAETVQALLAMEHDSA